MPAVRPFASRPAAPVAPVAGWGLVSSFLAPVLLIGGWTVAAEIQPGGFDAVRGTISDLAAVGMPHRWVMSAALVGVGACHVVTAAALRPAAPAGRVLLAVSGVATALVAANPLPSQGGTSTGHTASATVAFVGLACWSALATRRGAGGTAGPAFPPPRVWLSGAVVLLALLAWFFVGLQSGSPQVGLLERVASAAQSIWPLVLVVLVRRGW